MSVVDRDTKEYLCSLLMRRAKEIEAEMPGSTWNVGRVYGLREAAGLIDLVDALLEGPQ